MKLRNKIKVLSSYQGKTKFDFWNKLQENEDVEIFVNLVRTGNSGNGIYVPEVYFISSTSNFACTWNNAVKYLEKINYEVINDC